MSEVDLLTREAILGAQDIRVEPLIVPEWGGLVYVRAPSALERESFELTRQVSRQMGRAFSDRLSVAVWATVDVRGARIFTGEDVAELGEKSSEGIDRIAAAARRLGWPV